MVHFDGVNRKGIRTTGVVILEPGTTTPVYACGEFDRGSTWNQAELYAVLKGL